MRKVCKFGGSSLADAKQFQKVKQIINADDSRQIIVVSALGKRHAADQKVTDLLYLLHAFLQADKPCFPIFEQIRFRYLEIERALGIHCSIDTISTAIYANLSKNTPLAYLVSRGEYLSAKLMAEYLGFPFIDSARWLVFDENKSVNEALSAEKLKRLCGDQKIVTPGYYGISCRGEIEVFSRGGSDITGALAAKFLDADEYENWTDVDGLLAADPSIVPQPKTVESISYDDLILLSQADLQVLHSSCILPVKEKNIPLTIRNTNNPDGRFTTVDAAGGDHQQAPIVILKKALGNHTCLLLILIRDETCKDAVQETVLRYHPLFVHTHAPCFYALFEKGTEEGAVISVYERIYKKGSLG